MLSITNRAYVLETGNTNAMMLQMILRLERGIFKIKKHNRIFCYEKEGKRPSFYTSTYSFTRATTSSIVEQLIALAANSSISDFFIDLISFL